MLKPLYPASDPAFPALSPLYPAIDPPLSALDALYTAGLVGGQEWQQCRVVHIRAGG